MTQTRRRIPGLLLALAIVVSAAGQTPRERLNTIVEQDWASMNPSPNAWPDLSIDGFLQRERADRARLKELAAVDRQALVPEDRVLYDLLEHQLRLRIESFRLGVHLTPLWIDRRLPLEMPWNEAITLWRLTNTRDLEWLKAFPAYLDQTAHLLREGMKAGMLPSKHTALPLKSFAGQWDTPVELSSLYKPYLSTPEQNEARKVITQEIYPAMQRFHAFIVEEYLPKCPEFASLYAWPNGKQVYALLAQQYTGVEMSADELHQMGLREVARIREAILPVMRATGFQGSLDDFLKDAYSNPQFFYQRSGDLVNAYREAAERVALALSRVTNVTSHPQARIEPMRDVQRSASYGGGIVMVDVSALNLRPKFEVMTIMLHEGSPGHHLQVGRPWGQGAAESAMALRRASQGFLEGWGLYAESLGEDMGLFKDPYDRLGWLGQDLLRAVRVVIDSGVHGQGWSREQAIRYLVAQTGRPEALGEAEVSRLVTPGMQPSYKVGELNFKALRQRAETALGDAFDLAKFNDTMLEWGPLPMEILQRRFSECLADACLKASE